jgi:hypothetical protein
MPSYSSSCRSSAPAPAAREPAPRLRGGESRTLAGTRTCTSTLGSGTGGTARHWTNERCSSAGSPGSYPPLDAATHRPERRRGSTRKGPNRQVAILYRLSSRAEVRGSSRVRSDDALGAVAGWASADLQQPRPAGEVAEGSRSAGRKAEVAFARSKASPTVGDADGGGQRVRRGSGGPVPFYGEVLERTADGGQQPGHASGRALRKSDDLAAGRRKLRRWWASTPTSSFDRFDESLGRFRARVPSLAVREAGCRRCSTPPGSGVGTLGPATDERRGD